MKKLIVMLTILAIIFIACSKGGDSSNPPPPPPPSLDCSTVPKTFNTDVNPIVQTVCATNSDCHGSGSVNGPGPLLTYDQIFAARSRIGPAVASGLMPKIGSLTTSQKNTIQCWINAGGPNN